MSDDAVEEKKAEEVEQPPVVEQPSPLEEILAETDSAVGVDTEDEATDDKKDSKRRAQRRHISSGVAHVTATFNNTRVSISDRNGNVIAWCSGGRLGYKGSRKSTGYVAQQIGADAAKRAAGFGMRDVEVWLNGPGAGRESAARGIAAAGMNITILRDVTPIPHNGCRPPKRRRV